jgi:cobalt-zinc-cadmium efflux system outer membrane protein
MQRTRITNNRNCWALLALGASALCSANEPLTLEVAVARATERSEAAAVALAERDVASAQTRAARAWPSPTLEIESENVLGSGPYSGFDAAENTVSLGQDWQLGGQRRAAIRSATAAEQAAELGVQVARVELRRDVTKAFAAAIAADRLAEIARDRARIATDTSVAVEKRFAVGLESELGRSRVIVETSSAQAAARRAAAHAAAQRRSLASFWRDDTVASDLDGAWFESLGSQAQKAAEVEHPQLRQAALQLESAQRALERERAMRFPTLSTTLGVRRFPEAVDGEDQAFVLGLSVPLPFGDRNWVAIAEARVALTQAEFAVQATQRTLRATRASAEEELQAALLEARALAETGVPAARNAAELARRGYDAGRIPLLDRLAAERALSDAQEQLVNARLAVHHARATLESLTPAEAVR